MCDGNGIIKLNIGCGNMILEDWINVDLYNPNADIKGDALALPFPDDYADVLWASHVIEHFHFHDGHKAVREWGRVLKPGGIIIIETPNLVELCKYFLESDEATRIDLYNAFFSSGWEPGQAHLFLYTPNQLRWTLEQMGFENIIQTYAARYIDQEFRNLRMEAKKPEVRK